MASRDLVKEQAALYRASTKPSFVEVPAFQFLLSRGSGTPNGPAFAEAVHAMYAVAFTTRFAARGAGRVDYKVPPLEALWWAHEMEAFVRGANDDWKWALLLRVPDEIDDAAVDAARAHAQERAGDMVNGVHLETFGEGRAAQIVHLGPYDTEGPTIHALHQYIGVHDLELRGPHHEIYMSDPRRTRADRVRTIIRQGVN